MMDKILIIDAIDSAIRKICRSNYNYHFFRVGSSNYGDQIEVNDVDYLIVNESSSIDYTCDINNLISSFSEKSFVNAAVSTYDSLLNQLFVEIETDIFRKFKIRVEHTFGFGPIRGSKFSDTLMLHLAGPMNVLSCNYFFSHFPLFHFVWKNHHTQLGTQQFAGLLKSPALSLKAIADDYSRIYKRAKIVNTLSIKKQCIKRLKLLDLALMGNMNPYVEANKLAEKIREEDLDNEIEKYSGGPNFAVLNIKSS